MKKYCPKCDTTRFVSEFSKNKSRKDGLQGYCKECSCKANKEMLENSPKSREKKELKQKEYRKTEKYKEYQSLYASSELGSEKIKEKNKRFRTKHYAKRLANNNLRHASKMKRTPSWANLVAIQCYYQVASMLNKEGLQKWHVDHIVPLQGKNVSGLHVEGNLRVIPAETNLHKSNSWSVV